MDYTKMLFAYHARDLTMQRLVRDQPENLTDEGRRQWRKENFPAALATTVRELRDVAAMIETVD